MKKIIALVLIICCLGAMLCSCNKKLDLYEAYYLDGELSKTDSDYDIRISDYNEPAKSYSMSKNVTLNKIIKPKKSITLGNETIPLEYKRTERRDFDDLKYNRFENDDYFMTVIYDENEKLDFLYLGEYKYQISPQIDSEEALIEATNGFVDDYASISNYSIEIISRMNFEETDGFVAPNSNDEIVVVYEVNYNRYIDGIKTAEAIRIKVDENGYLSVANLNLVGAFDEFADVDIDKERYEASISTTVNDICTIDGYNLNGWTKKELLIILDGKLCVFSIIEPQYEEKDGRIPNAENIELVVPIAK